MGDTFVRCDQYNEYAGKTDIQCNGSVFHVITRSKTQKGLPVDPTEYDAGKVCEAHLPSFEELAARPAEHRGFEIVRRELVGTISVEGGKPANKEAEHSR